MNKICICSSRAERARSKVYGIRIVYLKYYIYRRNSIVNFQIKHLCSHRYICYTYLFIRVFMFIYLYGKARRAFHCITHIRFLFYLLLECARYFLYICADFQQFMRHIAELFVINSFYNADCQCGNLFRYFLFGGVYARVYKYLTLIFDLTAEINYSD